MTRILIVDDNPSVRAALRMCFKMKSDWIVCGEAESGDAAVKMARSVKPDVVLLDYAMPVMNGLEAARTLSALAPECAILMYTMFASPPLSELARAAGVRAVLSKDVNGIGAVIEAIEAVASSNAASFCCDWLTGTPKQVTSSARRNFGYLCITATETDSID